MASNDQLRFGQAFPGFGVANRLNPNGDGRYIYPDGQGAPLSQADAPSVAAPAASYPTWLTDLGSRGIGGDWTPTQGPAPDRYNLVSDFEASKPKPPPAPPAAQQAQPPAIPPGWDSAVQPYAHSSEAGGGGGGGGNTNDGVGNGGNTADAFGPGQGPSQSGLGAGGQSFGSLLGQLGDWLGITSPPDPLSTQPSFSFDSGVNGNDPNSMDGSSPGSNTDTSQNNGTGGDPAANADQGGQGSGMGGTNADSGSQGSGADTSGGSDANGGEGNFRGGVITQNKLVGPNPPGPDDGYASIKNGEGVLTVKAMQHYGPAFLARLNKLAVPKK